MATISKAVAAYQRIKKLRIKAGYTSQADFSAALNISPKVVSEWETGKRFPTASELQIMADVLHCSPSDIMFSRYYESTPYDRIQKLFECFPKGDAYCCTGGCMFKPYPQIEDIWGIFVVNNEPMDKTQQYVLEHFTFCTYVNYKCSARNSAAFDYMIHGINKFLGTAFTKTEMKMINEIMGSGFDKDSTRKFMECGFDTTWLREKYNLRQKYLNY